MNRLLLFIGILALISVATSRPFGGSIRETPKVSKHHGALKSSVPYQEKYFEVDIDHFNFHSVGPSSKKFQMRYLINADNWDKANSGNIFNKSNELEKSNLYRTNFVLLR